MKQARQANVNSYTIFLRYVKYFDGPKGDVECDASGVLSKECYQAWLSTRKTRQFLALKFRLLFCTCLAPKKPGEAFRRALTAHCRGIDGRRPFPELVEKSLLRELRKKEQWACFRGYPDDFGCIGIQGFGSKGYHERKRTLSIDLEQLLSGAREVNLTSTEIDKLLNLATISKASRNKSDLIIIKKLLQTAKDRLNTTSSNPKNRDGSDAHRKRKRVEEVSCNRSPKLMAVPVNQAFLESNLFKPLQSFSSTQTQLPTFFPNPNLLRLDHPSLVYLNALPPTGTNPNLSLLQGYQFLW